MADRSMRMCVLLPFIALFTSTRAQTSVAVSVILNKPEAGGVLRFAFCPTAEAYDSEKGCLPLNVPVDGRVVSATFNDVQPGVHAVKVFQDINANGQLDTSWLGWPKEPYGFSNDAPVNMGPPPFKFAAFTVKEGENHIRVVLR